MKPRKFGGIASFAPSTSNISAAMERVRALVDRLAGLDQQGIDKIRLVEDQGQGWKVQAAA